MCGSVTTLSFGISGSGSSSCHSVQRLICQSDKLLFSLLILPWMTVYFVIPSNSMLLKIKYTDWGNMVYEEDWAIQLKLGHATAEICLVFRKCDNFIHMITNTQH